MAADLRQGGDGMPGGESRGTLFGVRDAWWYIPSVPGQAAGLPTQGTTAWRAPNPPHGAVLTVYLPEMRPTPGEARRERERELARAGEDVPFPGFDALRQEPLASETRVMLEISEPDGEVVRRLPVPAREGLHRIAWDMRRPATDAVQLGGGGGFRPPWASDPQGPLVAPGRYAARLVQVGPEGANRIGGEQGFELVPLETLPGDPDFVAAAAFQAEVAEWSRRLDAVGGALGEMAERLRYMRAALERTSGADPALSLRFDALERELAEVRMTLYGDPARSRLSEFNAPGVAGRLGAASAALGTRLEPTATQRENLALAAEALPTVEARVQALRTGELTALEEALADAGAPWIPGQRVGG
jgi:hypothetical protein